MSVIEVRVPDIGDFQDVEIIEILVKPGDSVEAETSMITLENQTKPRWMSPHLKQE